MSKYKPAASLSGSLLARKGQAQPAMGPRSTSVLTAQERAATYSGYQSDDGSNKAAKEAPGSYSTPSAAAEPVTTQSSRSAQDRSPANALHTVIERALAKGRQDASAKAGWLENAAEEETGARTQPEATQSVTAVSAATSEDTQALVRKKPVGAGRRIAMTVRLDHDTHLQLKVLCAHLNRSSQEVFTDALRSYMGDHEADLPTRCACLKAGLVKN